MENITNQVISLANGKKYYVMRQALYRGTTYLLAAGVEENEEKFTDEFTFLEVVIENNEKFIKEVKDNEVLKVLLQNIKIEDIEE